MTNKTLDLQAYFSEKRKQIEAALDRFLPQEDRYPQILFRAMRYSVLDGGKRIRPVLVLAACEAVGGDSEKALPTACAVEFIHSFSLIHDDLPALDNDDFRRGKPTNHKVFGEAMAILAGDALLALAFETITKTEGVPANTILDVTRRIAAAAGTGGMVVGQVVDMESEGRKIELETLEFMHSHKTGALIEACIVCGGLLGGATSEQLAELSLYGQKIGLAFQIVDDILDLEGEQEKLGKTVGSDLRKQKSTFPAILGLEKSKEKALQVTQEALKAVENFDTRAEPLRAIARFIVERKT
ncbi:MAG: polyprenyl synthetase family protein [Armatimonadetes bacterium]|nr:polyprenyl synthetase family protein [Armatimonadota bacterium]